MGALNWNKEITEHNQELYKQRKNKSTIAANDDISLSIEVLNWANGDTLANEAKAPEYLINNILETDSHGFLVGASMSFKTFVALGIAHSICTGKAFMGNKVFMSGKVLYICGEGKGGVSRRLKAITLTYGDFNGNLSILEDAIIIDSAPDMKRLKQAVEKIDPVLIIFDTFSSLTGETIENDNGSVAKCLRLIKETCSSFNKTSSIVVHHLGKDVTSGTRGASAFLGNTDFLFTMEKDKNLQMITSLSCTKQKEGEEFNDIHIQAEIVKLGLTNQDGTEATSLVLKSTLFIPNKEPKKLGKNEQLTYDQLVKLVKKSRTKPVFIDDLKNSVFPSLKIAESSKPKTFSRTLEKLKEKDKVLIDNNIISIPSNEDKKTY